MQQIFEGAPLPSLPHGSVVTVGVFDGVHLGHAAVLRRTRALADELGAPAVVVTFDRHPASVVRPESAPRLLSTLEQRVGWFERYFGIDYTYVVRFDETTSLLPPEDFFSEVVVGTWHARALVEGEDFHFGHRRKGDASTLPEIGARTGVKVEIVPMVHDDETGLVISSNEVREALASSDPVTAKRLLGHDHELRGVVEHGDKRGRTIGVPTANVAVPGDLLLPEIGVYSGYYERPDGSVYRAAINIGRRPTFYEENGLLLVEAHLLDFDGDLYGEPAKVRVDQWIRGQIKFDGIESLAAQLHRDIQVTRDTAGG